jgi:hypothetical protein
VLYATTTDAYSVLDKSVSDSSLFPQATIDSYKTSASSNASKAKASLSSILTTRNIINDLSSSIDDAITLETKANSIANLKNTIAIQEATLADTKQ